MTTMRCPRCVMDTSDPDIEIGSGSCSNCELAEKLLAHVPRTEDEAQQRLDRIAAEVRRNAPSGSDYDCIVGLSGGVDSSYVALVAHRLGLRILAVHFDNGWNSEVAVSNIEGICRSLDVPLMTYVIDWDEFRDLQRSFLLASVIDVEMITDHAIMAALFRLGRKHKVRTILSGANAATESILPRAWMWPKQDLRNIRAIHREFGSVPLKTFPTLGLTKWGLARYTPLGFNYVELLNNTVYGRSAAIEELGSEVGWKPYGDKHHESTFTKFYQAHILPEKFRVDKRTAHLSSLIMNGEISRDEALSTLEQPPIGVEELARDRTFVLKKLGFGGDEFDGIMEAAPKAHDAYPSSAWAFRALESVRVKARLRTMRA